jgi:hypothetical protein
MFLLAWNDVTVPVILLLICKVVSHIQESKVMLIVL